MPKEPIRKQGAAKLCALEHCKGNPKNAFKAESFEGEICTECFACVWYIQSTLKPLKKKKISSKEKKYLKERELLEEGMETEAEVNSSKQMIENLKPKSKVYKKKKEPRKQFNLFEGEDEIPIPKKVEAKILRLGIEKEKHKLGTAKIKQCSNEAFWYRVFIGNEYKILREEDNFLFVDRFNIDKEYRVLKKDCEIIKQK